MRYFYLLSLIIVTQTTFAQSKLPVIKATSKKVSVRDGAFFDQDSWNLSPSARQDIFTADRTRETKYVTFYTDIDSIKVKLKPGTRFNFVILYNGKDSCYTRIDSAIPQDEGKNDVVKDDTIPFTLTKYNAIAIKAIINGTDTIKMHFDCGSFGFYFTREAIARDPKLKKINTLQLGTITWHNPGVHATGVTAHDMDGKIGYSVFDGKCLEINNDKKLLIIHSYLPGDMHGYKKFKIDFTRSMICLKGDIQLQNKTFPGEYSMDTGSDQAIIIDSTWAAQQNFPKNLKVIKTTALYNPRGVKYESRTVQIPHLLFNGYSLNNISALLLGSQNPVGMPINFLGNGLLKRFNIIFDFRKDYVYFKPDKLYNLNDD